MNFLHYVFGPNYMHSQYIFLQPDSHIVQSNLTHFPAVITNMIISCIDAIKLGLMISCI